MEKTKVGKYLVSLVTLAYSRVNVLRVIRAMEMCGGAESLTLLRPPEVEAPLPLPLPPFLDLPAAPPPEGWG